MNIDSDLHNSKMKYVQNRLIVPASQIIINYVGLSSLNTETLAIGSTWFASSAIFSTWSNTAFLNEFKDPLFHVFVRFAGSAFLGLTSLKLFGKLGGVNIVLMMKNVLVPALLLWIANFANSSSLQYSGITLTYVVKACIPVFTVIFCAIKGEQFPLSTYLSLVPTVLGVALASVSDMEFSQIGLLAALTSAIAQSLMNITAKDVRLLTGYDGAQMLAAMTSVCAMLTVPLLFGRYFYSRMNSALDAPSETAVEMKGSDNQRQDAEKGKELRWLRPALLVLANSLAYHMEYVLNMMFISRVNPVTFSVSDVARRLAIIIVGLVVFGKSLTVWNSVGVVLALGGVLWYSCLESIRAIVATKYKQPF